MSCITRVYQVHTDGIFLTAASSSMMVWQWSAMVWEAYPWRIIQMTSSEPLLIRALIPMTVSDIFQSWIQLRTSGTHFFTRVPAQSPPSLSHFLWIAATCPHALSFDYTSFNKASKLFVVCFAFILKRWQEHYVSKDLNFEYFSHQDQMCAFPWLLEIFFSIENTFTFILFNLSSFLVKL